MYVYACTQDDDDGKTESCRANKLYTRPTMRAACCCYCRLRWRSDDDDDDEDGTQEEKTDGRTDGKNERKKNSRKRHDTNHMGVKTSSV